VQAYIPTLVPVAENSRAAVLTHPKLAAFEIEFMIRDAIKKVGEVVKGPQDAQKGLDVLEKLTDELGPLKTVAHHDLHRNLAFLKGDLGQTEEQAYHRAFGVAMLIAFSKTGDGKSHETAYKIISVREEYVWFEANRSTVQATKRISKTFNDRTHDVWTVKNPTTGQESTMYFDAGDMGASATRVLAARLPQPASNAPVAPNQ
jgi:Domain of unknown function (DUF4919)